MEYLMCDHQWELALREKLNQEIPEGTYLIDKGGIPVFVSKLGRINYEVKKEKKIRELMLCN